MACYSHSFKKCTGEELNCTTCCAQEGECTTYYIQDLVGSTNNIQIGDKVWLTSECSGEVATAGVYTDCGDREATCGNDYTYGCVTVGSGGLVTAIAACSGEVACGDGPQANCKSSGTINVASNNEWNGRNKISVSALDSWEDIYKPPSFFTVDSDGTNIREISKYQIPGWYVKQIWIHNCHDAAESGTGNDKYFSVRLYAVNGLVTTLSEGALVYNSDPVEALIANRIKLGNGESKALLGVESPLKLSMFTESIQIQSHTSLDGFTISAWVEQENQNWDEKGILGKFFSKKDNAGKRG
jgi:hypothetical protein